MKYSSISKIVMGALGVLLGLTLICFSSVPANAQVTGATLNGTITDASGSALVGAAVSIKNISTGIVKETTTDSAGLYSVPNLQPSVY